MPGPETELGTDPSLNHPPDAILYGGGFRPGKEAAVLRLLPNAPRKRPATPTLILPLSGGGSSKPSARA